MISIGVEFTGLCRRIYELSEETIFSDGVEVAADQAKKEIATNFDVGGRPTWPLTQDGKVPLQGPTGDLKRACTENAVVDEEENGFELSPAPDQEVVAEVQDKRYGIFVLPDEAQTAVANALEKGLLEG